MMEIGAIGSPVDFATFIAVLYLVRHKVRPDLRTVSYAVVALARKEDRVDDAQLASELDVDEHHVDALEPTIVRTDGGQEDG